MSNSSPQSINQEHHSDISCDDNFENDDLIAFQHDSKTINLYYSQLSKYSKNIRESYLFPDVINRLPQEIHKFQEESQLLSENIDLFFQLLQQNYNINEDLILTYIQCIDLLKISKFLEVRKLSSKINQYIKDHNVDVDFIIQMIQYNVQTQKEKDDYHIEISSEIENLLTSRINECFSNDKFKELPIQIIYRVIKKCSPNEINSNKLFDIIKKSLSNFCVLFPFLDLQKLSEDRLEELCGMYSKSDENTIQYFDYLKCNLNLINEINNHKKNLQEMNDQQKSKVEDLETKITSLQSQFNDSQNLNNQQQSKVKDLEAKIESLQSQFNDSEKVNSQLQSQLNDSQNLNNEQQSKVKDLESLLQKKFNESEKINEQLQIQLNYSKNLESQISQLQEKLKNILKIKGRIVASVGNGLLINAEINLKTNGPTLDTSKSKVIVSTSDAKCLGSEAYANGQPITSLHKKTSFACKAGTYYVRCIVFDSDGKSKEIVSNSVTTSGRSLTFEYEGKPAKISLPQGKYKLEVWGAKGGDSTGNGCSDRGKQSMVQGGLGGYSRGTLRLNKKETVYVFVGEEGHPSNSSDDSSTSGSFPDGGGTKTGHYLSYTTVSGTGGGSTSIRIGGETNYSRVIVAGGGGGAGGSSFFADPGGFGGGLSGGHSYLKGSLQSQGAGTQSGSTLKDRGSNQRKVDQGQFGLGGTGKSQSNCDSGGGGGGGWYGGCSGGGFIFSDLCSSGGGGSGWTFTEKSLQEWQLGDSANAQKFTLNSTYYLTDVMCAAGNEEFPSTDGNGKERGHKGNGYAKITML